MGRSIAAFEIFQRVPVEELKGRAAFTHLVVFLITCVRLQVEKVLLASLIPS
jgi:hypothetical protein